MYIKARYERAKGSCTLASGKAVLVNMALAHSTVRALLCFRYTLFIVLYPMGVTGELLTIYAALPYVRQAGLYSISLPNKYNFSFDYHAFLILVMISYIPRKYKVVR